MWGTDVKTFRISKANQKSAEAIETAGKIDKKEAKYFHYIYTMRKQGLSEPKVEEEEEMEEE